MIIYYKISYCVIRIRRPDDHGGYHRVSDTFFFVSFRFFDVFVAVRRLISVTGTAAEADGAVHVAITIVYTRNTYVCSYYYYYYYYYCVRPLFANVRIIHDRR